MWRRDKPNASRGALTLMHSHRSEPEQLSRPSAEALQMSYHASAAST